MKFLILAACLIAAVSADSTASVVRSDSTVDVDGFNYAYETSNKIAETASGKLKTPEEIEVTGEFSYVSPEGTPVKVTYRADSTGFHPEGDVVPVGPPVPEWVERAIKLLPVVEGHRRR
ncbi:larval cuticle protein 9-like [Culicoides brevitarsis]|uniref:larval cuticle protein 9-like n=1 Tax=Culicoides brevitarsis TaxID=469753 RepID=UPI00307B11FC